MVGSLEISLLQFPTHCFSENFHHQYVVKICIRVRSLGGAVVQRDRKVAGSTPGRSAIKSTS